MSFVSTTLMIMRNLLLTFVAFCISFSSTFAQQMPKPALVGYWENWGTMRLTDIHENYNVIQLAFAKGCYIESYCRKLVTVCTTTFCHRHLYNNIFAIAI